MIKEKEVYTSPVTESLELRFEGMIFESPQFGESGWAGSSTGDENYGSF